VNPFSLELVWFWGTTDRLFTEKASGKDVARPQLDELIRFVRDGDTVVVHSMDRLARNLEDLRVEFVKEHLTFTGKASPMANLMLSMMGAFAEFERALIRELIYTQQSVLSDVELRHAC
jgi:DNA invertase Pin-like site-specific DNA recombinase